MKAMQAVTCPEQVGQVLLFSNILTLLQLLSAVALRNQLQAQAVSRFHRSQPQAFLTQ
jgi:hypothetical protein